MLLWFEGIINLIIGRRQFGFRFEPTLRFRNHPIEKCTGIQLPSHCSIKERSSFNAKKENKVLQKTQLYANLSWQFSVRRLQEKSRRNVGNLVNLGWRRLLGNPSILRWRQNYPRRIDSRLISREKKKNRTGGFEKQLKTHITSWKDFIGPASDPGPDVTVT